ncbi:MAG: class I SAM-dependent methyltransferase [Alphaproteobacteria bacterium]|nr:class I SAM-dependent methyltransferase [Alphaproteobacteria bacterium]
MTKNDAFGVYSESELPVFAGARNWKRYFANRLRRYIAGNVLEVGAGIGATTAALCSGDEEAWLCLEPEPRRCAEIEGKIDSGLLPSICRAETGTARDLPSEPRYNTILYIDVLEHIEDDLGELVAAARLLAPGGRLVVLAPAWQWLFSPFDAAIGHFRRYDRPGLCGLTPPGLSVASAFYLDSAGMLASMANRFCLRSAMPTAGQIRIWDRLLIPASRLLDPIIANSYGKSVVVVWRKGDV